MKSLYLTLASGRCGTGKLAELLALVPDMYAEHDTDHPIKSSCWFRVGNNYDPAVGRDWVDQRLNYYNTLPAKTIANTGHMIGEGFFERFVEAGVVPNIVTLRRHPREVATSMWLLNWIPYRNKSIVPWYIGPDEVGALPYTNYQSAHSYQLCYWWCCDTERRIQKYTPWLTSLGSKIWETTLPQILNLEHFNSMLNYFELPNINEIPQRKNNDLARNLDGRYPIKEVPSSDYLHHLEQEVLNSIPGDFKEHLEVVWKDYVAD